MHALWSMHQTKAQGTMIGDRLMDELHIYKKTTKVSSSLLKKNSPIDRPDRRDVAFAAKRQPYDQVARLQHQEDESTRRSIEELKMATLCTCKNDRGVGGEVRSSSCWSVWL